MDEQTKRLLQSARDHYRANEPALAEAALLPLAQARVPFADVYAMLGSIFHQKGRLQEAQSMLEEALRLNPNYTEAAIYLAVTYNELGKYKDSREIREQKLIAVASGGGALDSFVRGQIANMHADVALAYE